jgi:hypothetical protein
MLATLQVPVQVERTMIGKVASIIIGKVIIETLTHFYIIKPTEALIFQIYFG